MEVVKKGLGPLITGGLALQAHGSLATPSLESLIAADAHQILRLLTAEPDEGRGEGLEGLTTTLLSLVSEIQSRGSVESSNMDGGAAQARLRGYILGALTFRDIQPFTEQQNIAPDFQNALKVLLPCLGLSQTKKEPELRSSVIQDRAGRSFDTCPEVASLPKIYGIFSFEGCLQELNIEHSDLMSLVIKHGSNDRRLRKGLEDGFKSEIKNKLTNLKPGDSLLEFSESLRTTAARWGVTDLSELVKNGMFQYLAEFEHSRNPNQLLESTLVMGEEFKLTGRISREDINSLTAPALRREFMMRGTYENLLR